VGLLNIKFWRVKTRQRWSCSVSTEINACWHSLRLRGRNATMMSSKWKSSWFCRNP